jgi:predicted DNA-binding protein (UPF0251 family)
MVNRSNRRGALDLLRKVRSREVQPADVSPEERRVCVAYLQLEGYTQEEMAEIFQVHRQTIARDERVIRERTARLVDQIDVRAMVGGLIAWGEHIAAKAMREKDYALAWKVQRELISDLQSLGYLPKSVERHDVRITSFVELAQLAFDQAQDPPEAAAEALVEPPQLPPGEAENG